jgi:hypothetical protein
MAAILGSGCRSVSNNVGSAKSNTGMVDIFWVATEFSFVLVIHPQVSCIYADLKVFPVFRPPYWIFGMSQTWSEGASCSQFISRKSRQGASINSKRSGNGSKKSGLGVISLPPLDHTRVKGRPRSKVIVNSEPLLSCF